MDTTMKNAFKHLGKSYAVVARELGCSKTTLINIIVHGKYPVKGGSELQTKLIAYFDKHKIPLPIHSKEQTTVTPNQTSKEQDMLLRKTSLTQVAKRHFNLSKDPFNDEIASSEDIYMTPDARYVREAMYQTALHGGFVAVIGESGAGKSTLREELHDRLMKDGKPVVVIEPYVLAMEDNDIKGKTLKSVHIAEAILDAVAPNEKPKRSPEARFRQVHKALMESHKAGNRHVLVIEEAHGLPLPTLKHLKRFYELKAGFSRLIGIVLIGQTELATKLSEHNPNVREVVQRCELVTLLPLSDGKLSGYLKHKFDRMGVNIKDVLNDSAIDAITERLTVKSRTSTGMVENSLLYPLAVNNLVCAAINSAAELGFDVVDSDIVKNV